MLDIFLKFVALFVAMAAVDYSTRFHRPIRTAFRRLARHKTVCIILLAVFPIALRLAMLSKLAPPEPFVHDEFSYLLAGDTFAHGRMTNPTHPMWVHLETIHEQFVPTYASKYPPAQGLFLAFGQRVFGHPWAGVLLSVALMAASLGWMLQGWLPPGWALLGALIGVVNLSVSTYWMDSYWGGAVAAIGGCLVTGAYPRLRKHVTVLDSLLFALGILLLANTRPYEGMVLCGTVLIALLIGSWKSNSFGWVIPAMIVLAAGGAMMARYNYRVTGSPFILPYLANERLYAVAPAFLFAPMRPVPHYNHEVLRKFWSEWDVAYYKGTMANLKLATMLKLAIFWQTYVRQALLTIPLLFAPFLITSRRARFPLLLLILFACALLIQKGTLSHYTAPIAGIFFLILTLSLHRMCLWKPSRRPTGRLFANVVMVFWVLYSGRDIVSFGDNQFIGPTNFTRERRRIVTQLEGISGSHLIVVRYQPNHDVHNEWVYNDADIDGSKIVWAREMTPGLDQELLDYYRARRVWLLQPDLKNSILTPIR
jgi:hypothetical protein